ncbi:MAG: trypsin-like peptidase domain-containing protein [Planctomycetes bacterium]|nr:trypsin-like peptidase domain-containing protein [Planctomycetota bacterium]
MKRMILPCLAAGALLLTTGVVFHVPLQFGSPLAAQPGGPPAADPLALLSDRFEAVANKVLPAVVSVEALKPAKVTATGKGKPVEESGSGVIVKSNVKAGYFIITNNHVVGQSKNEQITIQLRDGRVFRPTAVHADPESDLAVLAINSANVLPTATLGNSDTARVGRWVLAIGSPFGLNQSVTHGIISARDRGQVTLGNTIRIKEFLQTDAAINPGSSGGPLIDMKGEVIGINTAIASHNGSNSGVAFSIPSNLVKRVMNQLLQQGSVQRGYLGMQLVLTFDPNDALKLGLDRVRGAMVEKVYAGTPAADSGLRAQDVILQVENIAIRNENHLINLISNLNPGQRVRMQVWRERSNTTLEAVVGDWSKAQTRFRTD